MKLKMLLLVVLVYSSTSIYSQARLIRKIEQSAFFVNLLLNKSKLQSFTDPSVKGSVSAYLNAVNANPSCARVDSFMNMRNEYYRIIDGVNGNLDKIIGVIESLNSIQDLKSIPRAKVYIDSINHYASAAPALFVRLLKAQGQVTNCNYGSGTLILNELIGIAMPFLREIFANRVNKIKLVLVQKINQLKFDRMTAVWEAAAMNVKNQSGGTDVKNIQLVTESQNGATELTREGAYRELGLSPIISCYTTSQVKEAYNAKLAAFKEIWNDPDFVKPEEVIQQRTRLLDSYSFLLNLFASGNCKDSLPK